MSALSVQDKREIARALLASALGSRRAYPLSYAQEQLWFMDKLEPGSPVYNIPLHVQLDGRYDVPALQAALAALVRRHDMLRTHFASADGRPQQVVEPDVPVELAVEDVTRLAPGERRAAVDRMLNEEVRRPFDLTSGPCVRYRVFRVDREQHFLAVTMHHIVTDAWSLGIFVAELRALYDALRARREPAPLPPLPVAYADYAQWQRRTLRGLRLGKLVKYWKTQLADAPALLHLPIDHARPKDQTFNGTVVGFMLDDDLSRAVIGLSRDAAVTPFVALLAAYYVLLFKYTGQRDLLVGAPVANRAYRELEPIIGLFVNSIVLRVRVREDDAFAAFLEDVNRVVLRGFEHQDMPFDKLVEELGQRTAGHPPVYQAVFNFQNVTLIDAATPSAEGEAMVARGAAAVHSDTAKVDLNLTLTQNGSSFSGGFEYNTDLFDRATIDELIAQYKRIVRAAVDGPQDTLLDLAFDDREAPARESALDADRFAFELED